MLYKRIPRLEVYSLKFSPDKDKDSEDYLEVDRKSPIDFERPFRIFLADRYRVFEMYDSKKNPLPKQQIMQPSSDDGINQKKQPKRSTIGGSFSTASSKQKSAKKVILPLSGPNGDIAPWDYFRVIIHQDTDNPEIDDSHLVDATPFYLVGEPATPSDVIITTLVAVRWLYDRYHSFSIPGTFGLLTFDWIAYSRSRLVTVGVKWLIMDQGGIEGGGQKKYATEKSSSYICGKLTFHSKQPFNKRSVLFKTPENKAIKVAHGESVPLLRSAVAVPHHTKFTFEADLHDPVNKSAVIKTSLIFKYHHFSKENGFSTISEVIAGSGDVKIEVKITMKPNDLDYLQRGITPSAII